MGVPQCNVRKIISTIDASVLPYRGHGQQNQTPGFSGRLPISNIISRFDKSWSKTHKSLKPHCLVYPTPSTNEIVPV